MGIAGTAQRNTCRYCFYMTSGPHLKQLTDHGLTKDLKGDSSLHGVCFGDSDGGFAT